MTTLCESYHNSAADPSRWWGEIVHPAHLDENDKFIPNSEFRWSATGVMGLLACQQEVRDRAVHEINTRGQEFWDAHSDELDIPLAMFG